MEEAEKAYNVLKKYFEPLGIDPSGVLAMEKRPSNFPSEVNEALAILDAEKDLYVATYDLGTISNKEVEEWRKSQK